MSQKVLHIWSPTWWGNPHRTQGQFGGLECEVSTILFQPEGRHSTTGLAEQLLLWDEDMLLCSYSLVVHAPAEAFSATDSVWREADVALKPF